MGRAMAIKKSIAERRRARIRRRIRAVANGRPRLSVFRSSKQIYAQIIDDEAGQTLVSASTLDPQIKEKLDTGSKVSAARAVGEEIAKRAKAVGIAMVVFDRGSYMFHGRVKALAEGARAGGLQF